VCDIARKLSATLPAQARVDCQRRYERIAHLLLQQRPKPFLRRQEVTKKKLVEQINKLDHDVARTNTDYFTLEPTPEALRQHQDWVESSEKRREELMEQLVESSISPIHFRSRAERMAHDVTKQGERQHFEQIQIVIQRYLKARINSASWAASLPLLDLLALEWVRDPELLWKFLKFFLQRWELTNAPREVIDSSWKCTNCSPMVALRRKSRLF
jgi:hypothetical protein